MTLFETKSEAIQYGNGDGRSYIIVYHAVELFPWQIVFREQFRSITPHRGDRGNNNG